MALDHDDIIEAKIPFGIFSLNLRALLRRITHRNHKPLPDPVIGVANRFLQLFKEHNVAVPQIPRFIPEISLEQLSSPNTLLPALTTEVLAKAAGLFGIEHEWLEGTTSGMYKTYPSYKDPWGFFEYASKLEIDPFAFPLVAFTSAKKLDFKSGRDQNIVLVMRDGRANIDEKTIYRYHIHDEFNWGYWKSRIQLKAMARIWYLKYDAPIRIYRVSRGELDSIGSGYIVPEKFYRNSIRMEDADLEDYALTNDESRVSKDHEELPEVLEYVEAFKLEDIGKSEVSNPRLSPEARRFTQ